MQVRRSNHNKFGTFQNISVKICKPVDVQAFGKWSYSRAPQKLHDCCCTHWRQWPILRGSSPTAFVPCFHAVVSLKLGLFISS
jgi:hypothetical protein